MPGQLMLPASMMVEWVTTRIYPGVFKIFSLRQIIVPHVQLFSNAYSQIALYEGVVCMNAYDWLLF